MKNKNELSNSRHSVGGNRKLHTPRLYDTLQQYYDGQIVILFYVKL